MIDTNKLILFGAGNNGRKALERYGKEKVAFFSDNNRNLIGKKIDNVEIISFEKMKEYYKAGYIIMITPHYNMYMIGQLEKNGINDYLIFDNKQYQEYNFKNDDHLESEWDYKIRDYVEECEKLDLIDNLTEFKGLVTEVLELSKSLGTPLVSGRLWESNHYGNLEALIDYAEVDSELIKYSPQVSHIDCCPAFSGEFYKDATIMSGFYYKYKIHQRYPYVPVFTVGPYIHYAKGIYSAEKLLDRKNVIGKMLLIFLPHSEEFVPRKFDKRRMIDEILSRYGSEFNSIWMCSFWVDINDDVCDYAETNGIHIVTAGFRFDSKFDRRLKTIIELSDAVLFGDIGTFIAYSMYLNKPMARIEINNSKSLPELEFEHNEELKKIELVDAYIKFEKDFYKIFTNKFQITQEHIDWMNPYAGFSEIRDKNYIQHIFSISKDIFMYYENNINDYPSAVREIYYKYAKEDRILEMSILKSAVGTFLD